MQNNLSLIPDSTSIPKQQTLKDTASSINNVDTNKIKPKKDSTTVTKKADTLKSTINDTSKINKKKDTVKTAVKDTFNVKEKTTQEENLKKDSSFSIKEISTNKLSHKPEIIVKNYYYNSDNDSLNNTFQNTFLLYKQENISQKSNIISNINYSKSDSTKTYLSNIKPINSIDNSNHIRVKNSDWFLGILILLLSIITILKLLYNKYFTDSIKSLWSYQYAYKLFKENTVLNQRLSLISNIFFILSFSLFAILCIDYFSISGFFKNNFLYFLIISGLIIVIYLIKYAVYKILGFIFLETASYSEYIFNVFQFNRIIGIFLIPIIIALAYSTISYTSIIVYSGFFILFIVFIMRVVRGFQICIKVNFSIFYSFLYLCVLEILPLIVIYKLIKIYI